MAFQCVLGQDDAVRPAVIEAREQYDESRAGTYDNRVGEHAQGLEKALLHGMRSVGDCGCIRGASLAGLIAEKSPLDSLHHGRSEHTPGHGSDAEGIPDNEGEY